MAPTKLLLLLLLLLLAEVHFKAVIVLSPFEMRRVPGRHVTYAQRIQTRFVQRADVAISRQNLTKNDQMGANADARQGGSRNIRGQRCMGRCVGQRVKPGRIWREKECRVRGEWRR